jgi:hypothetical protein
LDSWRETLPSAWLKFKRLDDGNYFAAPPGFGWAAKKFQISSVAL